MQGWVFGLGGLGEGLTNSGRKKLADYGKLHRTTSFGKN
jgi:hypothetical protein